MESANQCERECWVDLVRMNDHLGKKRASTNVHTELSPILTGSHIPLGAGENEGQGEKNDNGNGKHAVEQGGGMEEEVRALERNNRAMMHEGETVLTPPCQTTYNAQNLESGNATETIQSQLH